MPDKIKSLVAERFQLDERSKEAKAKKNVWFTKMGKDRFPHLHDYPETHGNRYGLRVGREVSKPSLHREDVTDETRRLAGIMESNNSFLLESRLSPKSAEATICKKHNPKPAKA
jgi:hypothetical protein